MLLRMGLMLILLPVVESRVFCVVGSLYEDTVLSDPYLT